ncbi:Mu transposase C-terminal domain-containing protein [Variovorax atrisoli]|uniref:Mu transposase C-terminal domain-containing protein n=1 Tax=Variovorax atrisoli TaxID=3394203 RepID=UPI00403FCCEF
MTGFMFRNNMAFEWKGAPFRVERLLPDDELLVEQTQTGSLTKCTRAQILHAYEEGHLRVAAAATAMPPNTAVFGRPLQDLPPSTQKETARRWRYVTQVLEAGPPMFTSHYLQPLLTRIAAQLHDEHPPSRATFYRWYKRYLRSGQPRGLVPRYDLRGSSRSKQADEVHRIFSEEVDKAFNLSRAASVSSISDSLGKRIAFENARRLPDDQLRIPHKRTVYRMVARMDAFDLTARREGPVAADRRFKLVGQGPESKDILERVEVDHTPLDLFLIDESTGLSLGKPLLTMFLDHYSRMPLGYYLSYGGASAAAVMGALRHAVLPKTAAAQVMAELRTEHAWPCYGLPDTLVLDNGLEFLGDTLESVALDLGIRLQFCPKHQPRFKGTIERFLKTCNHHFVHQLPGTSLARLHQRGDYDPAKHAVLTLGQFVQIFEKWMLDVYAQRPHRGLEGLSPWEQWKEGALRREPALPGSLDMLRQRIGLVSERPLRREGITLNSIQYNGEALQPVINTFGVGIKVRVLHDPNDLGEIFVWSPDSNDPVTVPALKPEYAKGLSATQHELMLEVKRERGQHARDSTGARDAQAHIADQVTKLMEDRKQSKRRKAASLRGDSSATLRSKEELEKVKRLDHPADLADRAELPRAQTAPALERSPKPKKVPRANLVKKTHIGRLADELNSLQKEPYKLPPLLPTVQLETPMIDLYKAALRRSI